MYKEGPYILSRLQNSLKNFPGEEKFQTELFVKNILEAQYLRVSGLYLLRSLYHIGSVLCEEGDYLTPQSIIVVK